MGSSEVSSLGKARAWQKSGFKISGWSEVTFPGIGEHVTSQREGATFVRMYLQTRNTEFSALRKLWAYAPDRDPEQGAKRCEVEV